MKVDAQGNQLWEKKFPGWMTMETPTVLILPDAYIFAGCVEVTPNSFEEDAMVIKFDLNGNLIWQKRVGGSRDESVQNAIVTANGRTLFSGYTTSNDGDVTDHSPSVAGTEHTNADYWIFELDNSGTLLWQKTIGGPLPEQSNILIEGHKGEIILSGRGVAQVSSNYDSDYWIVVLGPDQLQVKTYQPKVQDIQKDGSIKVNITDLAGMEQIKTAATDGLTKLILVADSDHPVTFTLTGDDNGMLSTLEAQTTGAKQVVVKSVSGKVIVIYTVPDGYGETFAKGGRDVYITARGIKGDTAGIQIKLVSPPVVLVHGMWSEPAIWNIGGFTGVLKNQGFAEPYLADYSKHSNKTFNPDNPQSIYGRSAIQAQVTKALKDYKDKHIAATQVDVIGHSLGGLMARSLSQQHEFVNSSNYHNGYYHKLITIGTPHRGSPLGPELWQSQSNIINPFSENSTTVNDLLNQMGMPIGSCHVDFGIESPGIKALKETLPFKTYAITSSYKSQGTIAAQDAGHLAMQALALTALNRNFDQIFASSCNENIALDNDLIVPLKSQTGYLDQNTLIYGTAHSLPGIVTETNNPEIHQLVAKLLLSSQSSTFGKGFPAPASFPLDCFTTTQQVKPELETSNIVKTKKLSVIQKNFKSNLRMESASTTISNQMRPLITSPTKGQAFIQGMSSQLKMSYSVPEGFKVKSGLFMIAGAGLFPLNPASNQVDVPLTEGLTLGANKILLLIKGEDGVLYLDSTHVMIETKAQLDSIGVFPKTIMLDSISRTASARVLGYFAGEPNPSNLTSQASGTTYNPKGESIFSVDNSGNVVALRPGTDTLIATHKGKTAKLVVIVSDNYSQRKMLANQITVLSVEDLALSQRFIKPVATATSGTPVTFAVLSGPAKITGGLVSITGTGKVELRMSNKGNEYFAAAPDLIFSFQVKRDPPANDNFKVRLQGETCANSNNGCITVSASQQLNYRATIRKGDLIKTADFQDSTTFNALNAGQYELEITTLDDTSYKVSYQLQVTEPKELLVYTAVNSAREQLDLNLSGGLSYRIVLNNKIYTTSAASITLPLQDGTNSLSVTTDQICQGIYEKTIVSIGEKTVFPNPFTDVLNVTMTSEELRNSSIVLTDLQGRRMRFNDKASPLDGSVVQLNTGDLAAGLYILTVTAPNKQNKVFKVIKK